ncbi:MAG TPA: PH domain-containing protein [Candidatus Nanopelagicaceae bacterium]|nr:PH domain-containing protein [Candidatus Nanopelagicaceae bacterium]
MPFREPWHRLHPLSPVVRIGRSFVGLVVVLALPYLSHPQGANSGDLFDLAVVVVAAVGGLVSWLVTRWRVEDGTLQVDTGLLRRRTTRLPLSRVQSIDIVRPGLARVLGLAEVRVRTAGAHDGDARLAYVASEQADTIRAHLLALAHGLTADQAEIQEVPLAVVRNRRLLVAVWLQGTTLVPLLLSATLLAAGLLAPTHAGRTSLLGVAGVAALVAAGVVGRQLNSQLGYEVAQAPDGLRVRGGLVGTVVETIPVHRIQAVREVEPLWWRLLGWVRMDVDVAGRQRRQGEDRGASGQLRMLLPVATRAEAAALLAILFPEAVQPGSPPPSRARLKAPLSFHFLRAQVTPGMAGCATGRMRRVSTWIPLDKVQSVRWTQGPWQRRLRLATVHLDIAGHWVGLALRDRDAVEAQLFTRTLPDLCRTARLDKRPTSQFQPTRTASSDAWTSEGGGLAGALEEIDAG